MTVPRDWHHPADGHTLSVAVSRTAGDAGKPVLMMAAGGPGGQGLLRPAGMASSDPALARRFEIVSFNQRGEPGSSPLDCAPQSAVNDQFTHDLRDDSPAAERQVIAGAREFAQGCAHADGGLVRYINSDQTAHDMDLFRNLLKVRTVSYYGVSYATWLGAYYATEFPHSVNAVVLDSNLAVDDTMQAFMLRQPAAFQRRFDEDFVPWAAAHDSTYHLGATPAAVRAGYEKERAALAAHPLAVPGASVAVGPNQLDMGTSGAIYRAAAFPVLAQAMAALGHWPTASADEQATVAQVFGSDPNTSFNAEFFAVACNDTPWTKDLGYWKRLQSTESARHPLVGARALLYGATCASLPSAGSGPRLTVTGEGFPPVLMLNSTGDPATPYAGALRTHRALRGSRLVTVAGGGDHGQFENGNACVDGYVDRYLLSGTLPDGDVSCPGSPAPE
ncbi:alpha/beta hydrolase [Mangrovactinospora gilvigrisea]|nr:alpha/beta hydrolase [Mangrovactinospora gilvigrisea]